MKEYAKQEIDGARDYFRSQGFEEVEANLGDFKFSYFVMPQEMEPNLNNFVYRCTGKPEDGYVFGISDNVQEEFRQYAVAHEFIEFMQIGLDQKDRCRKALEREIELVPEDIKSDYLSMRKDFFRDLIDYCSAKPEQYTQTDLDEFRGSLSKLEEIVK
jgi:hypothetical protein